MLCMKQNRAVGHTGMLTNTDWLSLFINAGAVWEYVPGKPHITFEMAQIHASFYFNTSIPCKDPSLMTKITSAFSEILRTRGIKPDRIVSYVADIADGSEYAALLAKRLSIPDGSVNLRTSILSFEPKAGERILVFADDIVSGNSLQRTIAFLEQNGASIPFPILTLGNLSGQHTLHNHKIIALFEKRMETWNAEDCPLCDAGSKALKARTAWDKLQNRTNIN